MNAALPEILGPWLAEVVLASGTAVVLLASSRPSLRDKTGDLALLVVAASAVGAVESMDVPRALHLGGMLAVDPFATFFKLLLSMVAMAVVWMSTRSRDSAASGAAWMWVPFLVSLLALDLVVSAVHALALWTSLEAASLGLAWWVAMQREDPFAKDRALGVFVEGRVASAMLLVGIVLLDGLTGSLAYAGIGDRVALAVTAPGGRAVLLAAIVFVVVGAGSGTAMLPWCSWRDVPAQPAPAPVNAWLWLGPSLAAFAALARFLRSVVSASVDDGAWTLLAGVDWPDLVAAAAMATITIAHVAALRAFDGVRLLAWLSVAQAGYLLFGLVVASDSGLEALLFHAVATALALLGAVATMAMATGGGPSAGLDAFRGSARRPGAARAVAVVLVVFLLSVAAVPPLAGFEGRARLMTALFRADRPLLALVAIANSGLGLLCIAKVVATMLDRPAETPPAPVVDIEAAVLVGLLLAATVTVGVWPSALETFVSRSVVFFGG